MWVNKLSVWYTWRHCRCWVTEKTMGASVLTCSRCCCCVLPFSLVEVGLRWSENKITNKTKAPKQDKQDSDTHIKHGQSYKYWGQSLFFFWFCLLLLFLLAQSLSLIGSRYPKNGHPRHTVLGMSAATLPTCCSNLLFRRDIQSDEGWLTERKRTTS